MDNSKNKVQEPKTMATAAETFEFLNNKMALSE